MTHGKSMKIDPIQAVIDAGSARLRVTVALCEKDRPLEILGCGVSCKAPCKSGVITDIAAAAESIDEAKDEAERQSGVHIRNVDASLGGPYVSGINTDDATTIRARRIGRADIERTVSRARHIAEDDRHELLHALEQELIVDRHGGIDDPEGMTADSLEVRLHVLRAERNVAENMRRAIEATGVGVNALVFSGLASAYAAVSDEERELGVCTLDIGAGTSDFMVFQGNRARYSGGLKIGGELVSSDIATVFSTPRQFAEILKCEQGATTMNMMKSSSVALPSTGLRASRQISSAKLVDIISTRYNEIFQLLEQALYRSGMRRMSDGGFVLTGGAARIPGLASYVTDAFSIPVRIAKPPQIPGLPEHLQYDPGMMTTLGILKLLYEPLPDHIWVTSAKTGIIGSFKSLLHRYL